MSKQCALRESVLACAGHVLVTGGPGSGKTTIALRKAVHRIRQGMQPGQAALFLSFSRAAVGRILDAAKLETTDEQREQLSIQTFHSFFWSILKVHGYLLGAPHRLSILLPHDEKALSGGIDETDGKWAAWRIERERIFREDGRIVFDLFAPCAAQLLTKSQLVLNAIARRYPIVIVDEAQDTGELAWKCIEALAPYSQIICLADLEQQIFDFLPGVGPERVLAIRDSLKPLEVDLGAENHRSPATEILAFGNDILSGKARGGPYRGVSRLPYRPFKPPPNWNHLLRYALSKLFRAVRAETGAPPETTAIIVSSNRSALLLSNALNGLGANPGKPVRHKLLFDEAESLLSARFAAFLLEPKDPSHDQEHVATSIELMAAAKRASGRARVDASRLLDLAARIRAGEAPTNKIVKAVRRVISELGATGFTGNPQKDWLSVKDALRNTGQRELSHVASQLDFLVAFRRGHRISAGLGLEWLRDGAYTNARAVLDHALAQEQLLDGVESPPRLQVMNFHKSKGKQFDGVIIVREAVTKTHGVESSFVWRGDAAPFPKSRRVLRVGITRARAHVLILDPRWPTCPLLAGHRL